VINQLSALNYQ